MKAQAYIDEDIDARVMRRVIRRLISALSVIIPHPATAESKLEAFSPT
jgi:hypothetical protein